MIRIEYQYWALHYSDRKYWVAIDNDTNEVVDYNSKDKLIAYCKINKLDYEVRRYHRNGGFSVIEKSNYDFERESPPVSTGG